MYCPGSYSSNITVNPLPVGILREVQRSVPATSTNLVVNMSVGTGPFEIDIQNYPGLTITGYVSGTPIPVSPASHNLIHT